MSAMSMDEIRIALDGTDVASTAVLREDGTSALDRAPRSSNCDVSDSAGIVGSLSSDNVFVELAIAVLPQLLLAKDVRTRLLIVFEEVARAELAKKKVPDAEVEDIIEKHIVTEQFILLVELFLQLVVEGCQVPERMLAFIDRHNASTNRIWAVVLLVMVIKTVKAILVGKHCLQGKLLAEWRGRIRKARQRLAIVASDNETLEAKLLVILDTADRLLRRVADSKQVDDQQASAMLAELEAYVRLYPPLGLKRVSRLARVLEDAHFSDQAKDACIKRCDGRSVIISAGDAGRFKACAMDNELGRDRLYAGDKVGFFECETILDAGGDPILRLFRPTQLLFAAVAASRDPLRVMLCGQAGYA